MMHGGRTESATATAAALPTGLGKVHTNGPAAHVCARQRHRSRRRLHRGEVNVAEPAELARLTVRRQAHVHDLTALCGEQATDTDTHTHTHTGEQTTPAWWGSERTHAPWNASRRASSVISKDRLPMKTEEEGVLASPPAALLLNAGLGSDFSTDRMRPLRSYPFISMAAAASAGEEKVMLAMPRHRPESSNTGMYMLLRREGAHTRLHTHAPGHTHEGRGEEGTLT